MEERHYFATVKRRYDEDVFNVIVAGYPPHIISRRNDHEWKTYQAGDDGHPRHILGEWVLLGFWLLSGEHLAEILSFKDLDELA